MKKAFLAALIAVPFLASCGASDSSKTFKLNGAGATFPASLYNYWLMSFSRETGNRVNYQAVGSGAGVRQFNANTIDFGASDGAVKDKDLPPSGMVQIPMTGGAIVPAYFNPECEEVKMTQTQLADVYLGKITNWKEFGCPDRDILVVYRSDGSGTTKGFTNSLSAFSSEWKKNVGTGKAVSWPVGVGAKGNSGVAAQVQGQFGALGYVNYGYVKNDKSGKLKQVSLQNKAGNFVTANAETSSAGLSKIVLDDKLRGADPNPEGANSYPIVSLTWILAYPESKPGVKETLRYMLSEESQAKSDSLGFVPLPEDLRQKSLKAIETINEEES